MRMTTGRWVRVAAAGAASALLVACTAPASERRPSPTPSPDDEPIVLVVDNASQALLDEYQSLHPNLILVPSGSTWIGDSWHYEGAIAEGVSPVDLVSLDDFQLGSLLDRSEQLVDFAELGYGDREADFLDWAWERGVDADGRLVALPAGIRPAGICYRSDLLAEAGIGDTPEQVAAALDGDWPHFFDVGRRYRAATGRAWYDHSSSLWDAMMTQPSDGHYDDGGELTAAGWSALKGRWDMLTAAVADGLSAGEWNERDLALFEGRYAVAVCDPMRLWELRYAAETDAALPAADFGFADVLPGGAASLGAHYLVVPSTSQHPEAAAALASWLTEPEQQIRDYSDQDWLLPATPAAITELATRSSPDPLFGDARVVAILANRTTGIASQPTGPDFWLVGTCVNQQVAYMELQGAGYGPGTWEAAIHAVEIRRQQLREGLDPAEATPWTRDCWVEW